MPPIDQTQWFSQEVIPHEPALRSYLRAKFPSLLDTDDLLQETYSRLLHARREDVVRCPRAFLFTTARNVALDLFRRQRIAPIEAITPIDESHAVEDRPGVAEAVSRRQELDLLAEAVRALPDRCRQVVMLRFSEGLSYKEIAARLGISPETVKIHLMKGVGRCEDYFAARGVFRHDTPSNAATA